MAKNQNKVVQFYNREPLRPKNNRQKTYMNLIRNMDIVVGIGPAGTGKTFVPSVLAADMLEDPRSAIENIIIVRPTEGPAKTIGYIKGGINEKMAPWAAPIIDAIETRLGGGKYAKGRVLDMIDREVIKLVPLEYIRGRSFNNSFIIIDEAQNCTVEEIKALTTRIGQDSKLVICGDIKQKDIKEFSGLSMLMNLSEEYRVPWGTLEFTMEDCVRSDVVKYLLKLYDDAGV